ncbi:MAG: class I SAM-dependent methyltransferase [Eubacterium sp.]|nr:class I SAM-dependent methyltransferase [Eubacterium sp.]
MISNKNIDGGKGFDWGLTSEDYAKYRDIYPPELYSRLRELGVAADGTSWLDLGTGTGILPQNLYNPNAKITGVDIAEQQIETAKEIAQKNGWNITYFASPAESTGLPDSSFECITAAQCFWYFDREKMQEEIRRMLKPHGKFIKIFMDWCLDDEIARKSTDLVTDYNSNWAPDNSGEGDLYDDLFDGRITEEFYCDIPFTRESWHGRMCACRGTLASMSSEQFANWCKAHTDMLSAYPESFTVKHKIYISYFTL